MVTPSSSFLESLYSEARDDEYLELRLLPSAQQTFIPVSELRKNGWVLPNQPGGLDVYFSVIPRMREGGKADDCSSALAVWTDYDNPNEKPQFCLVPSLRICTSPGKYQCFWLLEERCPDLGLVESINHSIAIQAGADTNAIDRARILRVPGFQNLKYQPNPPMVELLVNEPARTYTMDELRTAWPEVQPIDTYQRKTYTVSISAPSWLRLVFDAIVDTLLDRGYKGYPTGGGWKFECPFCRISKEPQPPLSIRPLDFNWFKCFSCEEKGHLPRLAAMLGITLGE